MKMNNKKLVTGTLVSACAMTVFTGCATAQPSNDTPPSLITADKIETRIGTLEFVDGAPTEKTAELVYDTLDFTRALNVYNNSFRGASAYGLFKGFRSLDSDPNAVVIFPT
jgi:hypothetical protein